MWITVPQAMQLVGRSRRTLYEWAQSGRVRTTRNSSNVLVIDAQHLLEVEPTVIRGRRPGSARPNMHHGAST
jgi:predicted site-specific integrase-resolvase